MDKMLGQRNAAFLLAVIICVSGLFSYASLKEGHDWGGDFSLYLRQAQSLLDGSSEELLEFNSYAMNNSTQQQGSNPQIGPHLYPWGFPILLLPVVAIWGISFTALKIYCILFFLLSLWVSYRLFLPRIGPAYSLLLVALLGFNPYLVSFADTVFADLPFLFFALLSIVFIEKSLGYRPYFINKTTTLILTGFLIFFSFLVRTNGIVLLGVLGLGHLILCYKPLRERFGTVLQQEWKELLPYFTFAFFLVLTKLILVSGSGSHLAFLGRITPGKLAWNIMYYTELPASFFRGTLFPMLFYGISVPFLLLGIWRRRAHMPDALYLIYCVASMIVFILWPPVQGLRFIFSLLPFYLYFVFIGLMDAQTRLKEKPDSGGGLQLRWVPLFCFVLGTMFLFTSAKQSIQNYPEREMAEGPFTSQSQEMLMVLDQQTMPDDTIVFFKPRVLSFMTGQLALRVTKLSEIREGKGTFLVYNKLRDFGQLPLEEFDTLRQQIKPAFENDQYVIIDLRPLSQSLPASGQTVSNDF